ncbi:long-chain fatty acid--CoA ligase [Nonomuraea endophytica]|uniref:long-chain fatty acid--CoA ligase n=1 Tax=Nonomuraea endophytica TaxID=714136 RepID=UPI0037C695F7
MLNSSVLLEDSAREYPARTAVVLGPERHTYAYVNAVANQVAGLLVARGIRPGDKVALACPNLPYFPMAYYGILKAGAVVVPLNVLLRPREIAYHLEDAGARAFLCFEGTPELPLGERGREAFEQVAGCEHFIPLSDELWALLDGMPPAFATVPTDGDDTAVILYTSGTTGRPKGAELTHRNIVMNVMTCDEMFERTPDDVLLAVLPLFHSTGQTCVMNMGLRRGGTLLMMPRWDPAEALRLMRDERVTFFAGVPTMYWGLVRAGGEPPAYLKVAVSGGAPLPLEVLKDMKETFGIQVLEGYGLSETSPVACFNRPARLCKPGSVGLPIWGVEMRLIDRQWNTVDDEGEIAIRGHNVMKGYHGRPGATAEAIRDGWFRTGDIGRRDEDGYYYIVDRAKDMIIRGGFNVYPRELEEVLLTHPAVSMAAVVGVPHESHGQEVKAYVIRKAEITEDELIIWCRENMAAYKYPRMVEFRDILPMSATGKILKRELHQ